MTCDTTDGSGWPKPVTESDGWELGREQRRLTSRPTLSVQQDEPARGPVCSVAPEPAMPLCRRKNRPQASDLQDRGQLPECPEDRWPWPCCPSLQLPPTATSPEQGFELISFLICISGREGYDRSLHFFF